MQGKIISTDGEKKYNDSYSHFGIHEEMLKDYIRTGTYRRAIVDNPHLFKDKIVLDIGCGTGILSLFAAQAGAKHVYGIDMAKIANQAQLIVKENNLEDRITIIKGKVEEIVLPVKYVDIIISEWMGYFLLYESMLDTVLYARDKWLRRGGLIFPDSCRLHICAVQDQEFLNEKFHYWENVYGFKLNCMKENLFKEPYVQSIPANAVFSTSYCVLNLDLYKVRSADLDFTSPFELSFFHRDNCHALVCYFDVKFESCIEPTGFSTAPFTPYTHWKQTCFYHDYVIKAQEGKKLTGQISVKKDKKHGRHLEIDIQIVDHEGRKQNKTYNMT